MSQQSQAQNESREQHYQQLDKLQRRQTRRYVFFPFFVLILLVLVIVGIMFSLRTPAQVTIVGDTMWMIFVLCPLVICTFPIVVLMYILVVLMNRLHRGTKSPLRKLEAWTYTMEKQVERWLDVVDNRVLDWAVRFAPIRRILTIFDTPSSQGQDGDKTDESTRTDQ